MAKHQQTCLVCGRSFNYYDAAPRGFCSVGCEADAGEPLADLHARQAQRDAQTASDHAVVPHPVRSRPAKVTPRSPTPGKE